MAKIIIELQSQDDPLFELWAQFLAWRNRPVEKAIAPVKGIEPARPSTVYVLIASDNEVRGGVIAVAYSTDAFTNEPGWGETEFGEWINPDKKQHIARLTIRNHGGR